MKNIMILISGLPATGKTSFAQWLSAEMRVPLLSRERFINRFTDISNIVFEDEERRRTLGHGYLSGLYWFFCEEIMRSSSPLIIEFAFKSKMKEIIKRLVVKYEYQTINVHFDSSIDLSLRRFLEKIRDNSDSAGLPVEISLEKINRITENEVQKDIKNFRFGNRVIYVDATDFANVSYSDIADKIRQNMPSLK